jgi:hypothetical protein
VSVFSLRSSGTLTVKAHLLSVWIPLGLLCLAGCAATYDVRIIKVHEIIQDMETVELDDPGRDPSLPETGILVKNRTDTTIEVKMRGKGEQAVSVSPGGSSSMALGPGNYHYKIAEGQAKNGRKSKDIYIELQGSKKISDKCLYILDVFTKSEVVKEKELEKLRSR